MSPRKFPKAPAAILIVACAACCAPLIAAPVAALIAVSGAGFAIAGQIGLAVLIVAGAGVYLWIRQIRCAKAAACACSSTTGCNAATSELPVVDGSSS